MAKQRDVLQGTLDLLVLKTLAREPLHGYGIAQRIEQLAEELLRVEEGSLYPALHRLEEDKVIKAEWGQTEAGRRARYYSLTAHGRKRLAEEEARWANLTAAVSKVLQFA